jgi:hypothetical protein
MENNMENTSSSMPNAVNGHIRDERISKALTSELWTAISNIITMKEDSFRDVVAEHIMSIYDVRTPKEKIKKRPDGLDYIESTWMDKTFKEFCSLYEYNLLSHTEADGWIDIVISLKDRVTGNVELGAGSAKIQRRRSDGEILDKGNNLKSALTNAIKNAQSRFGTGADVYGKREETRSDEEVSRFKQMLSAIKAMSPTRAQMFESQWKELGVDFTEFLDRWQVYIDRNSPAESKVTGESKDNQDTTGKKKVVL